MRGRSRGRSKWRTAVLEKGIVRFILALGTRRRPKRVFRAALIRKTEVEFGGARGWMKCDGRPSWVVEKECGTSVGPGRRSASGLRSRPLLRSIRAQIKQGRGRDGVSSCGWPGVSAGGRLFQRLSLDCRAMSQHFLQTNRQQLNDGLH